MIKGNESDVGNIGFELFELQAKICDKFMLFYQVHLFLNFRKLFLTLY